VKLEITIKNFKSIESAQLNLRKGLNILIGPNGSGKTCILSALKFIKDVIHLGAAQALARGGGSKRIYKRGKHSIEMNIICEYRERIFRRKKYSCLLKWNFIISQRGPDKIASIMNEVIQIEANISGRNQILFRFEVDRENIKRIESSFTKLDSDEIGRDLFSTWDKDHSNQNKSSLYEKLHSRLNEIKRELKKTYDRSVLSYFARFDVSIENLLQKFQFLNEYNILPEVARASSEQLQFAQMGPDGSSVSEVIYALEKRHFGRIAEVPFYGIDDMFHRMYHIPFYLPTFYSYRMHRARHRRYPLERALENINKEISAAVKPISSVGVQIDPNNGRRFVIFKTEKQTFFPEEVSDGTIKWLCILVSIFVPYSQVYLLEEPENFLHPWMQQRLVNIMREQAKKEDIIFILTSHSSTILNSSNPEEVLVVTQVTGGTKIREVEDKEEIEKVLRASDFRLGDLWVSGAIGGVPAGEQ